MPTSAAGNRQVRIRARYQFSSGLRRWGGRSGRFLSGFTLLELIVVITIIAVATAGVSLALRDSGQTRIDREAERLAALLESARAQSRTSGVAVRWRPVAGGFVFDGLPPDALPDRWLDSGTSAQAAAANGAMLPALQLGPDPIIAAQQVVISAEGPPARSVRLATDGLRPFAVVAP
ncbi:MAG: putative ral secretion pathway protein [Variovorax sp.]|nr:putative ral secretion pathway protein [Variovorax sp.]